MFAEAYVEPFIGWPSLAIVSAFRAGLIRSTHSETIGHKSLSILRSSGTHQRSILWPLGNQVYGFVANGNVMASRVALFCYYSVAQGCSFVIEQPAGSVASLHPRLAELFEMIEARSNSHL